MNQGLLHEVPEIAPAEASPAEQPRETAFAEHLRLLDTAVAQSRARAEEQDAQLLHLQAQVRRIREEFKELRRRAEDAELRLPLPHIEMPDVARVIPPSLTFGPGPRLLRLWPYGVLALAALALAPRSPAPMPQLQARAPAPPTHAPAATDAAEAITLVRAFRPEGSRRSLEEFLAPAARSSWEVERVGDGIFLVSFRAPGAATTEPAYEFTVDVGERSVTPEMDTSARLLAGG